MLHIAPEACLATPLKKLATSNYWTADLFRTDVDLKLDIHELPFRDEAIDAIYCSHVLQAVRDDTEVLQEIYRVLSPFGWGIVNVPSRGSVTKEFQAGGDDGRPRDFERIYGSDFEDKLSSLDFTVERVTVRDLLSKNEQSRMCVNEETAGAIYLITKNSESS